MGADREKSQVYFRVGRGLLGHNTYFALNPTCYLPGYGFIASAFTNYPAAKAITHPLFTPFDDARMHVTNALNIVDADLRAKMLGDAIT